MTPAKRPTVAAVMATYNYAHGISQAIDSILEQTLPPNEIIIVDDGSTDETRETIASYGHAVTYLFQPNQGPGAARNLGVRSASSDWIAFLDQDDQWLPTKLQEQLEFTLESGADFCYMSFVFACKGKPDRSEVPPPPSALLPLLRLSNVIGPSATYMVRRSLFLKYGGFNESLGASCEDWEFAMRMLPLLKFAMLDKPLVRYHYTPSSASRRFEKMLAKELSIEPTLMLGTSGLSRLLTRFRIRAGAYARAGRGSRAEGKRGLPYVLRSLLWWPCPSFLPYRFKTLILELAETVGLRRPPVPEVQA